MGKIKQYLKAIIKDQEKEIARLDAEIEELHEALDAALGMGGEVLCSGGPPWNANLNAAANTLDAYLEEQGVEDYEALSWLASAVEVVKLATRWEAAACDVLDILAEYTGLQPPEVKQ